VQNKNRHKAEELDLKWII